MAITYNNLYLDIRRQLRQAGIEAATLEARELVCFGTGKSREQLQRDGGLYASPELECRVRDLVDRHLAGAVSYTHLSGRIRSCSIPATAPWRKTGSVLSSPRWSTPL